jgi:hypothetical protein
MGAGRGLEGFGKRVVCLLGIIALCCVVLSISVSQKVGFPDRISTGVWHVSQPTADSWRRSIAGWSAN